MTGPGPYHENAEELDSSSGLTRWITGGLTPSLPARTQPILQGSAPVLPPGLFNKQPGPRPGAGYSEMNRQGLSQVPPQCLLNEYFTHLLGISFSQVMGPVHIQSVSAPTSRFSDHMSACFPDVCPCMGPQASFKSMHPK